MLTATATLGCLAKGSRLYRMAMQNEIALEPYGKVYKDDIMSYSLNSLQGGI